MKANAPTVCFGSSYAEARAAFLDACTASGVALVLIDAVNPWGFAFLRRVSEDNADVNRNFLDPAAPHPANADYDGLYDVLNPETVERAPLGMAAFTPEQRR